MPSLRREAIQIAESILVPAYSDNPQTPEAIDYAKAQAKKVVDALIKLRGFSFLATDEEKHEYGLDLDNVDISWSMLADRPITQSHINKQQAVFEMETMIDTQLARLPLNWTGFQDKDQDNFRKFLKKQRKDFGRELEKFVNWWMSDEWRVANPPWKLETIKTKWLSAFKDDAKPVIEVVNDENDIPKNY